MKTLLMVRHAKSSWEIAGQSDFERSLNNRGRRDAADMAMRLLEKKVSVDAFISSPAERAKKTAESFAQAYKAGHDKIIFIPALYHPGPATFFEVIENMDDAFRTVAIFSHNPGITGFVNMLTPVKIDDMPTCSVFALSIETNRWAGFEQAEKKCLFFSYPKLQL